MGHVFGMCPLAPWPSIEISVDSRASRRYAPYKSHWNAICATQSHVQAHVKRNLTMGVGNGQSPRRRRGC